MRKQYDRTVLDKCRQVEIIERKVGWQLVLACFDVGARMGAKVEAIGRARVTMSGRADRFDMVSTSSNEPMEDRRPARAKPALS